ncbi:MAG TPA: carbonate dehydratase [Alphaproteobacteria bacterium]|nr:carbonate dehydratase [Alphaproteobacteria bacterium]
MSDTDPHDRTLTRLLENNRKWAARIAQERPGFFEKLAKQQSPEVLWIGCSDSRVPANEIIDVLPGEVFVHRNVANQVMHVDFNCLAVLQFAVEALRVRHVIVCGHYGCGGVQAALKRSQLGLIDNWLYGLSTLHAQYRAQIEAVPKGMEVDALCEINVIEQVRHVCNTTIVQHAWDRGQPIAVHGWIYGIHNGRLNDLSVTITSTAEIETVCTKALEGPRLVARARAD